MGFILSVALGAAVAAATMDDAGGATFIALYFWIAGPPASGFAIAFAMHRRGHSGVHVKRGVAVAFVACLICGLIALMSNQPSGPRPIPAPSAPSTTVP